MSGPPNRSGNALNRAHPPPCDKLGKQVSKASKVSGTRMGGEVNCRANPWCHWACVSDAGTSQAGRVGHLRPSSVQKSTASVQRQVTPSVDLTLGLGNPPHADQSLAIARVAAREFDLTPQHTKIGRQPPQSIGQLASGKLLHLPGEESVDLVVWHRPFCSATTRARGFLKAAARAAPQYQARLRSLLPTVCSRSMSGRRRAPPPFFLPFRPGYQNRELRAQSR